MADLASCSPIEQQPEPLLFQFFFDLRDRLVDFAFELAVWLTLQQFGQLVQFGEARVERFPGGRLIAQAAEQLHLPLGVDAVAVEIGRERLFLDSRYLLLFRSEVKDAP